MSRSRLNIVAVLISPVVLPLADTVPVPIDNPWLPIVSACSIGANDSASAVITSAAIFIMSSEKFGRRDAYGWDPPARFKGIYAGRF
jgi:hypothetical protein